MKVYIDWDKCTPTTRQRIYSAETGDEIPLARIAGLDLAYDADDRLLLSVRLKDETLAKLEGLLVPYYGNSTELRLLARIEAKPEGMTVRLPCESMREAFAGLEDRALAFDLLAHYHDMTKEEREGIHGFFEGGGPKTIHELQLKHHEGTPTSADLEEWLDA